MSEVNNDNSGNDDLLKLIPPCNRESLTVNDIYNIDDILSAKERESLKPQAQFLINNGLRDTDERYKSNFQMWKFQLF